MSLFLYIVVHSSIFALVITLYLLAVMIGFSPRVWAMSDYPPEITDHVPPQTKNEKHKATLIYIPFMIIGIEYPLAATYILKTLYGGFIPLLEAFLNAFIILLFGFLSDFIILDWLIVGTITPDFVILPGTEHMRDREYKDFRYYHAKGHLKGLVLIVVLALIIATIVTFLIPVYS